LDSDFWYIEALGCRVFGNAFIGMTHAGAKKAAKRQKMIS